MKKLSLRYLNVRLDDDCAVAVEHGDGVVAVGLRDGQGFASHTLEEAFLDVDTLKPLLNG